MMIGDLYFAVALMNIFANLSVGSHDELLPVYSVLHEVE